MIRELRLKLEAAERSRTEPIAVIGIGCRLPGGCDNPDSLWQMLTTGARCHHASSRGSGSLLARCGSDHQRTVDSSAESTGSIPNSLASRRVKPNGWIRNSALTMEVVWEALENAGQDVDRLRGSLTGVFIGIHSASSDYYQLQAAADQIDAYTGTGGAHDVVAGRLNYTFDWRGPSLAVNTACSSSLVAVHLACQALRSGDCNLAIAGGVNLLLSPRFSTSVAQMGMLSPDGRCKPFDERANGFVRAEGCAAVILKRLSDAVLDEDPILGGDSGHRREPGREFERADCSKRLGAATGDPYRTRTRGGFRRVDRLCRSAWHWHSTGRSDRDRRVDRSPGRAARDGSRLCARFHQGELGHLEACAGVAGLNQSRTMPSP